jgi:hypothetical protein
MFWAPGVSPKSTTGFLQKIVLKHFEDGLQAKNATDNDLNSVSMQLMPQLL